MDLSRVKTGGVVCGDDKNSVKGGLLHQYRLAGMEFVIRSGFYIPGIEVHFYNEEGSLFVVHLHVSSSSTFFQIILE